MKIGHFFSAALQNAGLHKENETWWNYGTYVATLLSEHAAWWYKVNYNKNKGFLDLFFQNVVFLHYKMLVYVLCDIPGFAQIHAKLMVIVQN